MALLGGHCMAEGDLKAVRLQGLLENKEYVWMIRNSGEFIAIFCCLKKEQQRRRAEGEGSALIKLTVLLMSLWTQPLSFSLPTAT